MSAFDVFSATKRFQNEAVRIVNASEKPVLLVEGKTDAILISTAWDKLHHGNDLPYEVIPCGVEHDPEARGGGAEQLRRSVEFLANVTDKTIMSIFDDDRAGNERFNGLNAKAFTVGIDVSHKHHVAKNIHSTLLPTPDNRKEFTAAASKSYHVLCIEHYFSDDVLKNAGFDIEPILAGSCVFEIAEKSKTKVKFAAESKDLDANEFSNFQLIFDRLQLLLIQGAN